MALLVLRVLLLIACKCCSSREVVVCVCYCLLCYCRRSCSLSVIRCMAFVVRCSLRVAPWSLLLCVASGRRVPPFVV